MVVDELYNGIYDVCLPVKNDNKCDECKRILVA